MRSKNLTLAVLICLFVTVVVVLYLYNSQFDMGFKKSFDVGNLLSYLTLISAVCGGLFAYKILQATLDQRDVGVMPFLYVLSIQFSDTGIDINYSNGGSGPAVDVYWEPESNKIQVKQRSHHPTVLKPNNSTRLQRDWSNKQVQLNGKMIKNCGFILTCKDQIGNRYSFSYFKKDGVVEFKGAKKNGRVMVSN